MAPFSCVAAALAALLLPLLLAASAGAAGDCGCPLCGAAYDNSVKHMPAADAPGGSCLHGSSASAEQLAGSVDRIASWRTVSHDIIPPPAGPPPGPPPADAVADTGAQESPTGLLDKLPSPELCEALTAVVNAQVSLNKKQVPASIH